MSDKDLFLNRDLSWLEFNARVLQEASNRFNPLLERLRFLGIFQSNLDEYFMKRLGLLLPAPLARFREQLLPLLDQLHEVFEASIVPELNSHQIHFLKWEELSESEKAPITQYYERNIFPVLTPLSVDSGHPFPFLSNLSTSLGVFLKHADREAEELFARVKIPVHFPHWINVNPDPNSDQTRFISIIEVILNHLPTLFYGMEIIDVMPFRVTRNTNIEHEIEEDEDLMEIISEEIKERRFGDVVRLEYWGEANTRMLETLKESLEITDEHIYASDGLLEYTSLKEVLDLPRPDLKFDPWTPHAPPAIADPDRDLFLAIKQQDILVHHPYESFTASVERFIRNAVNDPKVTAIKMTLYRVGADSPLIPLLIKAAELGKHVVCLVELKARFDEEKNILVAQRLEEAGAHVVYGVVGLKTHCKLTLVVRHEGDEMRCYAHIGTGNYHSITSRLYTDFGLFTAKKEIVDDVVNLFHYLTGRSVKRNYQKLLVAPLAMKDLFLEKIEREIEHAKAGRPARIIVKVNGLDEKDISQALYRASQAGIQVDLIVRGICTLRPGLKDMSENIQVISIIGRFLEHSRIFYFQDGKEDPLEGDFSIGSTDWMVRNLLTRVEACVPIEERSHKERIFDFLNLMLDDRRQGWKMETDGSYTKKTITDPEQDIGTHQILMKKTKGRGIA